MTGRCRCGDEFCGTMHVAPEPARGWGGGTETIDLESERGMIIVGDVEGRIRTVETIDRPEVRDRLSALFD